MYVYHDFQYANYVMNSSFDEGYGMYLQCINRIDEAEKKLLDDRLWQSYIRSNKECTFEEYKKEMLKETYVDDTKTNSYSDEEKTNRSEEIIKRTQNLEKKMYDIENRKKVNNIVNEVIL